MGSRLGGKVSQLACGQSDGGGGTEERMVTTIELTLAKNVPKVPQKHRGSGEGERGGDREGLKQTEKKAKLEGEQDWHCKNLLVSVETGFRCIGFYSY